MKNETIRLAHFEAREYVMPIVSGLAHATKAFQVGTDDVAAIEVTEGGKCVIVRRSRLPDLVFTAMGHGVPWRLAGTASERVTLANQLGPRDSA